MCSVLTNKRAHLAPALSTQHNILSSHFYVDKTAVQLFSTFPYYFNEHFPWVCFMQGPEVLALCGCDSTNAKQLRRVHQTGWGAGTENIATTANCNPSPCHNAQGDQTAQNSSGQPSVLFSPVAGLSQPLKKRSTAAILLRGVHPAPAPLVPLALSHSAAVPHLQLRLRAGLAPLAVVPCSRQHISLA